MQSAANGRWKAFTSGWSPGQTRLWRSLDVTVCLPVRHSAAFSLRLIRLQSSPCAPFSERSAGSSSGKRGASRWTVGPTREPLPCFRCGWHARGGPPTRLAKDSGSACATAAFAPPVCSAVARAHRGKLFERVPPSCRLILISGLPLLEILAGSTGPSCVGQ